MKHLVLSSVLAALLPVSLSTAAEVGLQDAFPNLLPFTTMTNVVDPMDGTDRLFVTQKEGNVWVFEHDPAVSSRSVFLQLSVDNTWECGLLGLAFDPNYKNNGRFYVYYTRADSLICRLSRFHVSAADSNLADPASEEVLLEIPQTNFCHKAGCLAFGPDGYLYLSVGDDCQGWPAQDRTSLMGKLLRLDVRVLSPGTYTIPPDNPFVGNTNGWREEIYAYGFRNPWRFSIDPDSKRLWLGDVGENTWEEANLILKGRNYGWIKMEGNDCYPSSSPCDTAGANIVLPIFAYLHASDNGESITGGYVYRGHTVPSVWGKYVYADYVNGIICALSYDGVTAVNDTIYNDLPSQLITTFGVDKDDELLVGTLWGHIYRMVDLTTGVQDRVPAPKASLLAEPNPFRTATTLRFAGSLTSGARVDVFDVRGRLVRSLGLSGGAAGGSVAWNGADEQGRRLASGVYFARLMVDGRDVAHQRIVLVR